ncbi:biotin/lipoyl-binding protein [uncultured Alistipes sp.]
MEIRPQVSGQITDIRMKEGDAVRKDSVLSSSTRCLTRLRTTSPSPM